MELVSRRMVQAILRRLVLPLPLLLLAAACSGGEPALPDPEFDATPAMLQAVDQLVNLETAAFTLEHLEGSTTLFPGVEMNKVWGVVDIPGKFEMTVEAEIAFPKSYLEISLITVDGAAYMTDILSGDWREVSPESLPFDLSGLGDTLAGIVEAVQAPELVEAVKLKGIDTYHLRGVIKSEDLADLVPGAGEGYQVLLDLWLGQTEGLLHRVLISGRVVPSDGTGAVRQLTLDDINLPVNIRPPV